MKHLFFFRMPLRAAILGSTLLAASCTADSDFRLAAPPADSPLKPSLHLYPVSVKADAAGGTYRIVVAASGEWLAEPSGECTLLPRGGDSGTREMTVTLPPNESREERLVRVTVRVASTAEEASETILFTQPAGRKPGIGSAEELQAFAAAVNAGEPSDRWADADGTIRLTADIDLAGVTEWTPIGLCDDERQTPFTGVFDGNGFRIVNCRISSANGASFGLFGCNEGTIRNLTLTGTGVSGAGDMGAICGRNAGGILENCHNHTRVSSDSPTASVGGICAVNLSGGVIRDCSNAGEIKGGGWIGGISGQNGMRDEFVESRVASCRNAGTVVSERSMAGGIAGVSFSVVSECTNSAAVRSGNSAAGIVALSTSPGTQQGTAVPSVVEGCTNEGEISGSGNWSGGIVGTLSASRVSSCGNSGTVQGIPDDANTSRWAGGVVGTATGQSHVEACTNSGRVYSPGNYCGGIVGYCNGSQVERCKNEREGLVRGSGSYIGGVVGDLYEGSIVSCANYGTAEVAAETALDVPHHIGGICGYNYFGSITGSDYLQGHPPVICPKTEGPGVVN